MKGERNLLNLPFEPLRADNGKAFASRKQKCYNGDMGYILGDYEDYLDNSRRLNRNMKDTKVLFPKNFDEQHDRVVELVKLLGNEIRAKAITNQYYNHIFDYYYEDKDYCATLPRNVRDLKYEGDKLHHCAYTNYAQRTADGKCIIIMIRKKNAFTNHVPLLKLTLNHLNVCRSARTEIISRMTAL